jgi:hypothetical protein
MNILGTSHEFQILNVCKFNSTQKQMLTVVHTLEGKINQYCNSTDTVILEQLTKSPPSIEKSHTTSSGVHVSSGCHCCLYILFIELGVISDKFIPGLNKNIHMAAGTPSQIPSITYICL